MSIHTSHRLIVFLAASIYAVLVLVVAIYPAWREQEMHPPSKATLPPLSPSAARGRVLYQVNGCWNCHTQQIRGDERLAIVETSTPRVEQGLTGPIVPVIAADRRFGRDRASRPEDYARDDPTMLGTQRTGPDLTVVGTRLPAPEWHYWHLYEPRSVSPDSIMPGMRWMFVTDAKDAPPDEEPIPYIEGLNIPSRKLYPTQDAKDLVEYLMSLVRHEQQ